MTIRLATHTLFFISVLLLVFSTEATASVFHHDVEVRGVIEALGDQALTVGGLTFLVNEDTEIEGPDGEDLTFDDLDVGMLVEVEGEFEDGELVAEEIEVQDGDDGDEVEVEGFITALGDSTLTVGGLLFRVTPDTDIEGEHGADLEFEDLAVGDFAEVEGHFTSDDLVADEIEVESDQQARIEVEGFIEALGDHTLTVGSLVFLVTEATEIEGPHGQMLDFEDLEVGQFVEVEGHFRSDGTLVADEVEVELEDDDEVEVSGVIEELGPDFLVVSGVSFIVTDTTEVVDDDGQPILFEDLTVGLFVEVHGRLVEGDLVAIRIEVEDEHLEDEVRAQAAIDSIEPEAVVLLGQAFLVTDATVILGLDGEPITLDDLAPGDVVEVEAERRADGSLVAFRIEREDSPADEVELRAVLDMVGTDFVVVLNVTFLVDDGTIILDRDDNPIELAELTPGDLVDVEAMLIGDILLASRIEVRRAAHAAGRLTSVNGGNLGLPGVNATVASNVVVFNSDGDVLSVAVLEVGQAVRLAGEGDGSGNLVVSRVYFFANTATAQEPGETLPASYTLSPVYPNPFNPQARFTLEMAEAQSVRISVFDLLGREIRVLHDGSLSAGSTGFVIDGAGLPSGLYVVRAAGDTFTTSRRMTLLR
ncbi:MAG: T9SS type A sorting domain-containing protein [Bacteroidetes bacterium]|nr:T9SS type A sorting domain-containing protein [Bacteroidota bacterium]